MAYIFFILSQLLRFITQLPYVTRLPGAKKNYPEITRQPVRFTQLYHVTQNGLSAVEYQDLETRQGNELNQTAAYYIQERETRKPYEATS